MFGLLSRGKLSASALLCSVHQPPFNRSTSATTSLVRYRAMFSRAVQDHPQGPKPLQLSSSHLNVTASTLPAQAAGAKRKFDLAESSRGSSLGTLHDAVYFDENDFDDDDVLELDTAPIASGPVKDTTAQPSAPARVEPVKTPPLPDPPAPPSDSNAPTSSVPLPWSSSPTYHYLPPAKKKPRSLPWSGRDALAGNREGQETRLTQEPRPKQKPKTNNEPRRATQANAVQEPKRLETPAAKKTSYPWNTTMSAVKAEQKELRKLQKQRVSGDKKHGDNPGQPTPKLASIFLSDEQRHVLDVIVNKGASVFFTGSAGTGKSVLMREVIKKLRDKYKKDPDRVAVTASTGLAACNIEGVTLHSFAGVGLGKESAADLVKKVKRNQKARTRWLRTKVLIIDEVSMVDGDFFDKLEELSRKIRNNGRPFGGIQLVVTGDFFQLPPVPEGGSREARFAFGAATWNTSIQHTILLTQIFRQKDPEFASMLNEMRLGRLSPATNDAFRKLSRPLNFHDSLEATELFPTRNEVEDANAARMNRLSGELMTFNAIDSGTVQDQKFREKLLANCMAPPTIHLKKGAQVMLIKNMDETLVNGSLGKVVAFMDPTTFDYYNKHEDEFTEEPDDKGSATAAAARSKIRGLAYDPKNGGVTTAKHWPVVSFVQPDGTERQLLCQPESWKIELPNGEVQAQRQQVPLILAWALSIHKAQGQTLQRVKVDLGRVFEKGQAYVALSRATSQAGLQVSRFDPRKVMVHNKVTDFYANLSSIKQIKEAQQTKSKQKPKEEPRGGDSDYEDDDLDALDEMYGQMCG